ncbi:hypothetical protein TWF730_001380 [Orbilia blumenaviensis]|uniref:Uncharacterized protein n=1 Tax=Orbilia blumenaviensis TaxID=1796055 RepID=A0AAV9UL54_9PEZI
MSNPPKQYLSSGQVMQSPPLTARITRFSETAIQFIGLYFVTLLSFDSYASAESSSFATHNNAALQGNGAGSGGSGFGGGSGGGSGGRSDPRGPGRRLGTIDAVRAPECGSCQ